MSEERPRKPSGRAKGAGRPTGSGGTGSGGGRGTGDNTSGAHRPGRPARPAAGRQSARGADRGTGRSTTGRSTSRSAGAPRSGDTTRRSSPAATGVPVRRRRPATQARVVRPSPGRPPRTLRLGRTERRLRVGFLLVAFVMSVFAGRLVQLQGFDGAAYANAAVKERISRVTLHATRGEITDATGVPLATTVDTLAVTADPTLTRPDAGQIAETLAPILKVDQAELTAKLRTPRTRFVYLDRRVPTQTWKKARDALRAEGLGGVLTEPDPMRTYPSGQVAANIIGFAGSDGGGLSGIEYALDGRLRGKDGHMVYERGLNGQQIPLAHSSEEDPVPGANVRLTINRDVQWAAQQAIAAQVKATESRSGDVVVMDTRTGELVAVATAPTFDPNHPTKSPAEDRVNRPFQEVYEPGSVAKVLTASALVDSGYVTPSTRIRAPGYLIRDGRRIGDWWGHGTVNLTFAGALARSSNIGVVLAAEGMPKKLQASYLRKFGMGKPTAVQYPGESGGTIGKVSDWSPLRRATISFGQGMSVTAVQLTAAVAAVANGGVRVDPSLVKGFVDDEGKLTPNPAPRRTRVVSKQAAATVARMMEQVVQGPDALATKAAIPGYRIAGKTGTAQRADSSCGCYRGYTASFAGFAPADDPRFVVYVDLQDPKKGGNSGSGLAAPVFHDIMAFTLQKYGVPPTGTKSPVLPLYW
ncbi:penicillin-binding protein 2 [Actinopolymorpha sp. NPDC004070]|uniref:peptidoglycan D,D-transpeptidase FtsI family protein n=1 Tax=Actinopolymorpha sp. NPDC004070 TaxID=3154548 RepID=UPI0033BEBD53